MLANCCVCPCWGGGHHGGRGTMTAATMVGVCVVNVTLTLPRHIMKPAYCSILFVFLDVSSRAAMNLMGVWLHQPYR